MSSRSDKIKANSLNVSSRQRVGRFFVSVIQHQSFTFLLLILVIVGLASHFYPASLKPSQQAHIGDTLGCNTDKASDRLRQVKLTSADQLKVLVSFQQQPTAEQIQQYADQGITLYPDSWLFDYLMGETSYSHLCNLLSDKAITYVDLVN